MPRLLSFSTASLRTRAPVASMVLARDMRRMTTRTSATSASSSRKRWAAAKNSGPSIRYATVLGEQRVLLRAVVPTVEGNLVQARLFGHGAQGERARDHQAEDHGVDEVEGEGGQGGQYEDQGI